MAAYSVTSNGSTVEIEADRAEVLTDRNQVVFYDDKGEVVGNFFGASFYKMSSKD